MMRVTKYACENDNGTQRTDKKRWKQKECGRGEKVEQGQMWAQLG